jgi:hypothetical protein
MKRHRVFLGVMVLALTALPSWSQTDTGKKTASAKARPHVMVEPEAVKWGPPPASVIAGPPPAEYANQQGLQFAVIEGDPSKPGAVYTVRFKTPDGFRIAPHWHPTDEHLTVLQGTFGLGDGDTFDRDKGHEMKAGGYLLVPGKMHHFAWTKGETIVQAHGVGPFKVYWVIPGHARGQKPKAQ